MDQKTVGYVGRTASVFALLMLLSYADQIALNIEGKTGSLLLPLFTVLNCLAWTVYGFFKKERDWNIVSPNAVGVVIGIITELSGLYCRSGCPF